MDKCVSKTVETNLQRLNVGGNVGRDMRSSHTGKLQGYLRVKGRLTILITVLGDCSGTAACREDFCELRREKVVDSRIPMRNRAQKSRTKRPTGVFC